MNELVTIATFDNSVLANVARNKLESEGIRAFLENERTLETQWLWSNAAGGIRLRVADSDAEWALKCLEETASFQPPEGTSAEPGADEPEQALVDADDDEIDDPNLREQDAARAFKAAVLGLLFCPLQFYAFWLVLKVFLSNEPLRPRYWWFALAAAVFSIPLTMSGAMFAVGFLQSLGGPGY
jgi:hypothetical protein